MREGRREGKRARERVCVSERAKEGRERRERKGFGLQRGREKKKKRAPPVAPPSPLLPALLQCARSFRPTPPGVRNAFPPGPALRPSPISPSLANLSVVSRPLPPCARMALQVAPVEPSVDASSDDGGVGQEKETRPERVTGDALELHGRRAAQQGSRPRGIARVARRPAHEAEISDEHVLKKDKPNGSNVTRAAYTSMLSEPVTAVRTRPRPRAGARAHAGCAPARRGIRRPAGPAPPRPARTELFPRKARRGRCPAPFPVQARSGCHSVTLHGIWSGCAHCSFWHHHASFQARARCQTPSALLTPLIVEACVKNLRDR